MRSSLVPPLTTPFSTPAATARIRREMNTAQVELASGRIADIGLKMGGRSSLLVSARSQEMLLFGLKTGAAIGAARLTGVQQSLELATSSAQELLKSLSPLLSGQTPPEQVSAHARSLLSEFATAVNATVQGSHVFGGKNMTEKPLTEYFSQPPSAARTAVENAFVARFGMPPADPAAAAITAAQMEDFLDNDFARLFASPQWENLWSKATDEGVKSLISLHEITPVTESANNPAIRKLAMAFVMVAGLGIESLNAETRQVIARRAMTETAGGIAQADRMKGEVGYRQERIARAQERLDVQHNMISKEIAGMERVDLNAVASRVNELSVRLETSYSLTGRLQKLTLLNYL